MDQLPPSILVADDDADVRSALKLLLKSEQYSVSVAASPNEVLQLLSRKSFSCILLDLNYSKDTTSGKEGLALVDQIRDLDPQVPIVALTGFGSIDLAVDIMKSGANDFIEKPWRNSQLLARVKQQVAHASALKSNERLAQENALLKQDSELTIVAESQAMKSLLSQIERIAKSDMNVLFTGENGTGKSMLANYLHQHSNRAGHSFLSVNMGAVSETLFESEMFGHNKGAFTDAKEARIGRFELAEKGTLFLDEIANVTLNQQAKLLHVLEEKKFERVGSTQTLAADVRLVSATNADLKQMVTDGRFRQDLLYRLNTVELTIPSLRDRLEDILPLAQYFIRHFSQKYRLADKTLTDDAQAFMLRYAWPGNIRELSHTVERALFLSQSEQISLTDLNLPDTKWQQTSDATEPTLEQMEKTLIIERLEKYQSDPLETARSLGLSRSAYYRRLDKFGLNA